MGVVGRDIHLERKSPQYAPQRHSPAKVGSVDAMSRFSGVPSRVLYGQRVTQDVGFDDYVTEPAQRLAGGSSRVFGGGLPRHDNVIQM